MESKFGWTKDGPCKILSEEGAVVTILRPGRVKQERVSRTHLFPVPAEARLVRFNKHSEKNFDQNCGCTAIIDVKNGECEPYNVYGNIKKYLVAKDPKPTTGVSPHHRRKMLAERGYNFSLGKAKKVKANAETLYSYAHKGYKLVGAS